MSSLSQQLQAISARNASVALDRKSRAHVHSHSLIFEPKVAAAQDYEYIYQIACEGLDELVQIDARFSRFHQTLFAPASVAFDRNVSTKETVAQAEKNAIVFMNLAAPYFALAPAIKAMEWLVRRYHANIHCAEPMLLAALPHHSKPVFTRFMSVIPKSSWPAIFAPIVGYRETSAVPQSALVKCFRNDPAFFRLYTSHVIEALKNSTVYKEQLVFWVANTAQAMASHARDTARLNEHYIPVVLEAAAAFLEDRTYKNSPSLAHDVRLAIYSVLAVLSAMAPLREELVFSLTRSVLQSTNAVSATMFPHTVVLLGQVWHFYNETDVPRDAAIFAGLASETVAANAHVLFALADDHYHVSKFLYFFVADKINSGDKGVASLLGLVHPEKSDFLFDAMANKLLDALDTPFGSQLKSHAVSVFELMARSNRSRLSAVLATRQRSWGDLEMMLSRTLGDGDDVQGSVNEDHKDLDDVVQLAGASDDEKFQAHASTTKSFLTAASSREFARLVSVLLASMQNSEVSEQTRTVFTFVSTVLKNNVEAQCSFLLRVAATPAVPSNVRLVALKCVSTSIQNASKTKKYAFYLMAPLLLLILTDASNTLRGYAVKLLEEARDLSAAVDKKSKCALFMETQIYGDDAAKRSIIAPSDGRAMLDALLANRDHVTSVLVDPSRVEGLVFDGLFKAMKSGQKKFGSVLLRTFVLHQWALAALPLVFKWRAWTIVGARNVAQNGSTDRFVFVEDVKAFFGRSQEWRDEASDARISFSDVENAVVELVGGPTGENAKEISWFLSALGAEGSLQKAASTRLVALFPAMASEQKMRVCNEMVDLVVADSDLELAFDPLATLQALHFSSGAMVSLLSTVNIVTQVPEQGVAKRRRRSSSSTQKNMARDDISAMAAHHLRKLAVILDVLEAQLRKHTQLATPDLLQQMFKILTDLDYLCSDGKMPVLYAQETLATCMLLAVVAMKSGHYTLDSNSVRADLIVNSIRLSQSPQVQNRLLLVVAELAALAPEIILHSVMPIFTFMGAHTVRQDDEFSSSALQQTIAKVVPAITAASSSADSEIEFLLTSFVTAFQHIPRHRRVSLFVSLVRTLGARQSLHTILFLIGQQYASQMARHRAHECDSLVDFVAALLKTLPAEQSLHGFLGFFELWAAVPSRAVEKDSDEYASLSSRSIYGAAIVSLGSKELQTLRFRLLRFLNKTLAADEDTTFSSSVSLKMKVALTLFDDESTQQDKDMVLQKTSQVTAFILAALESASGVESTETVDELYESLKAVLNLLPLSHYLSSILESLANVEDAMSVKVAKNFALLAGSRFDSEITRATVDDSIDTVVAQLMPVLITGVETNTNTELVQAYLDTFATIVTKYGGTLPEFATTHAKFLVGSLRVLTSKNGLLSTHVEIVISSLNAIASVVNCLGVKCIGFFPKILPPALAIWESTLTDVESEMDNSIDTKMEESSIDIDDAERRTLLQGAVLMLLSCLVKRMPAFVVSSLIPMIRAVLMSNAVDSPIRAGVLGLMVEHVDRAQVLQAMCNMALTEHIYEADSAVSLGLYLNGMSNVIDSCDKKAVTGHASLFMRWMIASFEFRSGESRFNDNTIHSIEGSFHECGLRFVMKLNDKNFRPLFASLVRWAVGGENAREVRLVSFFKFFNKLQDSLRSIITSYFSYLLDATVQLLDDFRSGRVVNTNLRRIVLHSLASSFKYDQDDYWTHQSRFDSVVGPLVGQLANIEDSIGKHLVKSISFFVANVFSDEHNEKLVQSFIRYISNEHDNTSQTKIWTVRVMKTVLQKMGEQWLAYLPMFIPYIAELLEDDDEAVEMEVRKDLVRVIETILGEPLDRYLS